MISSDEGFQLSIGCSLVDLFDGLSREVSNRRDVLDHHFATGFVGSQCFSRKFNILVVSKLIDMAKAGIP